MLLGTTRASVEVPGLRQTRTAGRCQACEPSQGAIGIAHTMRPRPGTLACNFSASSFELDVCYVGLLLLVTPRGSSMSGRATALGSPTRDSSLFQGYEQSTNHSSDSLTAPTDIKGKSASETETIRNRSLADPRPCAAVASTLAALFWFHRSVSQTNSS